VPEPLLRVESLAAGYGEVQVLWGIDLEVMPAGITAIVGSNGAGKSTLLKVLSGMIPSRAGRIVFAGRDVTGAGTDALLAAGIAHVPEGRRLFRGLTVRDNLLLGAFLRSASRQQLARDLDRIYSLFPILADRRHQDATTMSGGEQQMCAIGRGLMAQPQLLMIDELSLGLAPRAVDMLADSLCAISREGLAILLVEQDVLTAFELSERAYVIETGRVVTTGESRVLADDPRIRDAYLGTV
jgi:branched-chain amino acid transport system ATP-binding protein